MMVFTGNLRVCYDPAVMQNAVTMPQHYSAVFEAVEFESIAFENKARWEALCSAYNSYCIHANHKQVSYVTVFLFYCWNDFRNERFIFRVDVVDLDPNETRDSEGASANLSKILSSCSKVSLSWLSCFFSFNFEVIVEVQWRERDLMTNMCVVLTNGISWEAKYWQTVLVEILSSWRLNKRLRRH